MEDLLAIYSGVVCIAGTAGFDFGNSLPSLGLISLLIDTYSVYASSTLAATTVLRSIVGVILPLITSYMYAGLGIHWASSVPAFLSLACVPIPILLICKGPWIPEKSRFAREARKLQNSVIFADRRRPR